MSGSPDIQRLKDQWEEVAKGCFPDGLCSLPLGQKIKAAEAIVQLVESAKQ